MPSEGFDKYAGALEYISHNVSSQLAIDLHSRLAALPGRVGMLMEHEATTSGAHFVLNAEARRTALRALLLCQRAYLNRLSDKAQREEANWPRVAVDHWKSKSENEIKAGISIYTTQPRYASLADVAAVKPDDTVTMHNAVFKLSRDNRPFPVDPICYRAVQSWLMQAGYVNLQWFMQNVIAGRGDGPAGARNNGTELLHMFGNGDRTIDVSNDGAIPLIPRNHVVYMYKANADLSPSFLGALGHWMVSQGDGTGYGRNNAQSAADAPANSWAHCSISEQIREMRPKAESGLRTCIRIFDPATFMG